MSSSSAQIPRAFKDLFTPCRYKIYYGGRGGGKSWGFSLALLIQGYERPLRVLCTREVQKSIKQSVHKLLADTISRYPHLSQFYTVLETEIRGLNGTSFAFHGLQNHTTDSLKSFEGIDRVWIEEAHSVSRRSWEILIPTIRKEGSEIWASFNPNLATDYVYKRFVTGQRANSIVKKVGWQDNPFFTSVLDEERREMLASDPEAYEHIWEGGLDTRFSGAIFAKYLDRIQQDGQVKDGRLWVPDLPVHTAFDLGMADSTAIWFFQLAGTEVRVIDYYENNGEPIPHYCEVLAAKPYTYGDDWVPHDAKVRELGTGKTRIEVMKENGRNPRLVPDHTLADGIEGTRKVIPTMWIDSGNCEDGLDAVMQYRYEYDDDRKVYKTKPLHDWSSHAADAFRYMSMAVRFARPEKPKPKPDMRPLNEQTFDEMIARHDRNMRRGKRKRI